MYDYQNFKNVDECADWVAMWYIMGFIFFFLVSVPAMLIALEIIYYWSKDLNRQEQEDEKTEDSPFDDRK